MARKAMDKVFRMYLDVELPSGVNQKWPVERAKLFRAVSAAIRDDQDVFNARDAIGTGRLEDMPTNEVIDGKALRLIAPWDINNVTLRRLDAEQPAAATTLLSTFGNSPLNLV